MRLQVFSSFRFPEIPFCEFFLASGIGFGFALSADSCCFLASCKGIIVLGFRFLRSLHTFALFSVSYSLFCLLGVHLFCAYIF